MHLSNVEYEKSPRWKTVTNRPLRQTCNNSASSYAPSFGTVPNKLGEQLRSEFQHGFDDLNEAFRDGQTELLRAFYSFAQN